MVRELVFVIDNDKKRQNWKLGLVHRIFEGKDGKARVADVKVGKTIFRRAFQRLIPLEIRSSNTSQDSMSYDSGKGKDAHNEQDKTTRTCQTKKLIRFCCH